MKKYELTEETINVFGKTLHRIRATRDFSNVHAGDLGGFIENELNLSHDRDTWVYGNAWAYGEARVYGNALVSGDARVYGNALVSGDARVEGKALVGGDARVEGNALVSGNARVGGNALVSGNARVYGEARVKGPRDIYWISCIGSRDGTTTFFRNANNSISVS
uniref:polymer-forming cytoskeletal protein n=1 Tax=Anaerotruncus colihominis TaxID=169435 RepID=UPI00174D473D